MARIPRFCSVEGCGGKHNARGLCKMHYSQQYEAEKAALRKPSVIKQRQDRLVKNFWAKMDKSGPPHPRLGTPCWIWQGADTHHGTYSYGYGKLGNKSYLAHRRAFTLATGIEPGKLYVCHKCDVPLCCNPDHLFLGTQLDNMKDAATKGRLRYARGEQSSSELSETVAQQILDLKGQMQQKDIAAKFGVSKQLVSRIHRRVCWRHLKENTSDVRERFGRR
jgi:hypothetical protein